MYDVGKPTVLLVDDVPANIKLLGAGLQGDFTVLASTSGPDGLQQAVRDPQPDLILLDIAMPEMDGLEVCRRLKANEHTRAIPVIFLTSMDDQGNESEGFEVGAVDYVTKPFSLPIIKARIRIHVELRRHREFLEVSLAKSSRDLKRAQEEMLRMMRRG